MVEWGWMTGEGCGRVGRDEVGVEGGMDDG